MSAPIYLTGNRAGIQDFLDRFDVFLLDCDDKRIVFVTNNSTKSRAEYSRKLTDMGIPAVEDEIFSSSYSAAIYISRILTLPADKRTVFVLGEGGIGAELSAEGIRHIGGADSSLRREMTAADFGAIADGSALDASVGVVLCGLDRHVNYLKLALAFHYLQRGARFVATNTDSTLPSAGALFPGAGAVHAPLVRMLAGLRRGGGGGDAEPDAGPDDPAQPLVMGKPALTMLDAIEGRFHFDRARTCMVGDRLDTDIRFGVRGGLGGTLAVLTGVSRRQDWERERAPDADDDDDAKDAGPVRPGWWADRLTDLRAGM
ncbi:MAG: hypothetical protein M1826_001408 [Phylliscum demangeonii]|nr:MAG: hypothetical protein M1826_001408 [Phylliscum demangeonii]